MLSYRCNCLRYSEMEDQNVCLIFHSLLTYLCTLHVVCMNVVMHFWSFGPSWSLLAFVGLHCPFWPLWPWTNFKAKPGLFWQKFKHNRPVSTNQMSKPISKWDRAFQFTVAAVQICALIFRKYVTYLYYGATKRK